MTMTENKHFNWAKMVSCKVTTIENQRGYRWNKGALGAPGGVGASGAIRGCRGVLVSWQGM